jgi:hypothetical protein
METRVAWYLHTLLLYVLNKEQYTGPKFSNTWHKVMDSACTAYYNMKYKFSFLRHWEKIAQFIHHDINLLQFIITVYCVPLTDWKCGLWHYSENKKHVKGRRIITRWVYWGIPWTMTILKLTVFLLYTYKIWHILRVYNHPANGGHCCL